MPVQCRRERLDACRPDRVARQHDRLQGAVPLNGARHQVPAPVVQVAGTTQQTLHKHIPLLLGVVFERVLFAQRRVLQLAQQLLVLPPNRVEVRLRRAVTEENAVKIALLREDAVLPPQLLQVLVVLPVHQAVLVAQVRELVGGVLHLLPRSTGIWRHAQRRSHVLEPFVLYSVAAQVELHELGVVEQRLADARRVLGLQPAVLEVERHKHGVCLEPLVQPPVLPTRPLVRERQVSEIGRRGAEHVQDLLVGGLLQYVGA